MKFNITNLVQEYFRPNPPNGGTQIIYRFTNDYGASVVSNVLSYGMELAVLRFTGPDITDYKLCYESPITQDVIGHLNPQDLENILIRISQLN